MQQLRSGGVLEAIRISCAGYPTQRTFFEFLSRYRILCPEVVKRSYEEKAACTKILENMGIQGYQIGKTKVFLRAGQMADLDAQRVEKLSDAAKTVQRNMKTYTACKKFVAICKATLDLQAICRGRLAYKHYEAMRKEVASIKIQKDLRRNLSRKAYKQLNSSALVLQTFARKIAACNQFKHKKQAKSSTMIQANWRRHQDHTYYKKLNRAALVSQCRWRGRLGRKELRKLKMAAGETSALKEAKNKLEKKVEELTCRLQSEKRLRTDLEESKGQEISKLQQSLTEMQKKVDETIALLAEERSVAKKAIVEVAAVKETPVPVEETGNMESLTHDVDNFKSLTEMQKKVDETNSFLAEERAAAKKAIEEAAIAVALKETPVPVEDTGDIDVKETPAPVEDTGNIESLTPDVDNFKALWQLERQKADDWEKKYSEAREESEERKKKLDETEKRVHQLQESLNRMIYCMTDQFSELKTFLHDSSILGTSSEQIAKDDRIDVTSTSSDDSSSGSDFTSQGGRASSSATFSVISPDALQLIVQDLTHASVKGFNNRERDQEGAFDDFF